MKPKKLSDAELLILGLVAEMPRHGYELEQVITQRGMREWTQIGFSSIYFVLDKLEKLSLLSAAKAQSAKSKKVYQLTNTGQAILVAQSLEALSTLRPSYSSVLLGMVHWPALNKAAALAALQAREQAVALELARLEQRQFQQQPLPDYLDRLFDFARGQLAAETQWITNTLEYMSNKPDIED